MSERLNGKIGIVTGAGRGIGRPCAIALARKGAYVEVGLLIGDPEKTLDKVCCRRSCFH